jgi:hypothetical protein
MYSEAVVPQTGRRSADVRCRTIRELVLCAADPAPSGSSAPCDQAGTCCVHSPARQIDAYTELERNLFIRRLPPGEQLGGFERDQKLEGDLGRFVLLDLVCHPAAPLVHEAGIELVLTEDMCQFSLTAKRATAEASSSSADRADPGGRRFRLQRNSPVLQRISCTDNQT